MNTVVRSLKKEEGKQENYTQLVVLTFILIFFFLTFHLEIFAQIQEPKSDADTL